ncbi:cyclophilin-like fold protein (plasmid) [Sinorhizobium chiapasense]|uniref:cyclophilin-like fold protein n=1 Tax=Sinorhizobium/Ensifer group TaxID=227292 RepID=UPI001FCCFC9B|nr:cyclophilin-like fold protein [Ensifer sp. Root278]
MQPRLGWTEETNMKVRFIFADHDVTVTLYDNQSARDFASMLPLDLTFSDFGNEKIAYLPRKLNLEARGPFPDTAPGDLCYYIPWGNLAFFYGNYVSTRDLIRLGRVDGGVEPLLTRGEFPLRIERLS